MLKTIAIEEIGLNSKYKNKWGFIAKKQVWVRVSEWKITRGNINGRGVLAKLT